MSESKMEKVAVKKAAPKIKKEAPVKDSSENAVDESDVFSAPAEETHPEERKSLEEPPKAKKTVQAEKVVAVVEKSEQKALAKTDQKVSDDESRKRRPVEDANEGDQAKKSKVETVKADPAKPKVLRYIPWRYLTANVIIECCKLGAPYLPANKAGMSTIFFDYEKFAIMCPECPKIAPRKTKMLYSNHPFLRSSFGYSPHTDEEGKLSNCLRFEFEEFVTDEAREFQKHVTDHWKIGFATLLYNERSKYAEKYLEIRCRVVKPDILTLKDVQKTFKAIDKEPQKASFANYIQFSLDTLKDNEKLGIKGNPYLAYLEVWGMNPDPETGKPKRLATKLEEENGTDYDGEDAKIIFDKGMYAEGIFRFNHINFTGDSFGLTMKEETIKIASREDFMASEQGAEEECPF